MRVIKFEDKSLDMAKEEVIKELKNATNFFFVFSDDNLSKVYTIKGNCSPLESISMLEIAKHRILHDVLGDDDDDDGTGKHIPERKWIFKGEI